MSRRVGLILISLVSCQFFSECFFSPKQITRYVKAFIKKETLQLYFKLDSLDITELAIQPHPIHSGKSPDRMFLQSWNWVKLWLGEMWISSLIFFNELFSPTGALYDALLHKIIKATHARQTKATKNNAEKVPRMLQTWCNKMQKTSAQGCMRVATYIIFWSVPTTPDVLVFQDFFKNIAKPFAGGEVAAKVLLGCTAGRKGGHFGPEVKIIIAHIFTSVFFVLKILVDKLESQFAQHTSKGTLSLPV